MHHVRRTSPEGRTSFSGPFASVLGAAAEVAAWERKGWTASREPETPELLAEVRAWEHELAGSVLAHATR